MNKERNLYIDVLKAISIILVILGHCIQYGTGGDYGEYYSFFYHPVFIFIYSFHMPLFMIISGYLFAYSCKNKSWLDVLKSKAKQLLIPLAAWSVITTIVQIIKIVCGVSPHTFSIVWMGQCFYSGFWGGPWFLWAIWWGGFLVIIGRRFFKDNLLFYLLVCLATLVMPDAIVPATYKFMLPYFVLAYLFNAKDYKTKFKKIYTHNLFAFCCFIAFVLLLPRFNFDSYIYTTGFYILDKNIVYQIHNNSFRFFIGLVGSLSAMYFVYALMDVLPHVIQRSLAYIGASTLGIYIISNYIFDEVLRWIPITKLNYWYVFLECVCILGVSLLITVGLKKTKVTNRLFLGGR